MVIARGSGFTQVKSAKLFGAYADVLIRGVFAVVWAFPKVIRGAVVEIQLGHGTAAYGAFWRLLIHWSNPTTPYPPAAPAPSQAQSPPPIPVWSGLPQRIANFPPLAVLLLYLPNYLACTHSAQSDKPSPTPGPSIDGRYTGSAPLPYPAPETSSQSAVPIPWSSALPPTAWQTPAPCHSDPETPPPYPAFPSRPNRR